MPREYQLQEEMVMAAERIVSPAELRANRLTEGAENLWAVPPTS